MQKFKFTCSDGSTIDVREPDSIEYYDWLIEKGVSPLSLMFIIGSPSIQTGDGKRVKVFSQHSKEVLRRLAAAYSPDHIKQQCRTLFLEHLAGCRINNLLGLLVYRIKKSPVTDNPSL